MHSESRTIALNGIDGNYLSAGGGPPMVLLQGLPETPHSIKSQIEAFAKEGRLAAAPPKFAAIPTLRIPRRLPAAGEVRHRLALDRVGVRVRTRWRRGLRPSPAGRWLSTASATVGRPTCCSFRIAVAVRELGNAALMTRPKRRPSGPNFLMLVCTESARLTNARNWTGIARFPIRPIYRWQSGRTGRLHVYMPRARWKTASSSRRRACRPAWTCCWQSFPARSNVTAHGRLPI